MNGLHGADTHSVLYSEDYSGDVDTATWVVLNDVIPAGDTWHDNGPLALPTTGTTVNIAFRYTGYDGSNCLLMMCLFGQHYQLMMWIL